MTVTTSTIHDYNHRCFHLSTLYVCSPTSDGRVTYKVGYKLTDMDSSIESINQTFHKYKDLFYSISQNIWNNPELRFKEHFAHQLLTDHLEKFGFQTTRSYVLPTGFKAHFSNNKNGPVIAIICEYDALPGLGHACGHNLISEAGFATAVAVKAALEADTSLGGTVVVFGTPAEEGGGGKIHFIKAGAFDNVDVALMAHPGRRNIIFKPFLARKTASATFNGKSSHASSSPWLGKNALDAAVNAYTSIGLLRQQIHPDCRIGVIISEGGQAPNVIPSKAKMEFGIRATTTPELDQLVSRVKSCCESGAVAAGCDLNFVVLDDAYDNFLLNVPFGSLFKKNVDKLGLQFAEYQENSITASTDMSNVSQTVPSIHPTFRLGDAANHTIEFANLAKTEEAHNVTLEIAKAMALTCLDLFKDHKLIEEIKEYFYQQKK